MVYRWQSCCMGPVVVSRARRGDAENSEFPTEAGSLWGSGTEKVLFVGGAQVKGRRYSTRDQRESELFGRISYVRSPHSFLFPRVQKTVLLSPRPSCC